MFFSGCDFGKEGIVKAEAAPKADVGQEQTEHAPFQVFSIEEMHGHAGQRPGVTEDFHQLQFLSRYVGHPAQQGGGDDDHDETGRKHVAVQLGIDELPAHEGHDVVDDFTGFVALRSEGVVENRENGSGDDEGVHAVRPIVHGPSRFDFFRGIGSGCAHASKIERFVLLPR